MTGDVYRLALDAVDAERALFHWDAAGDADSYVTVRVPRDAWERSGRPLWVTLTLADTLGAPS